MLGNGLDGQIAAMPAPQNRDKKGHTSEGIHDALFPASVGDGVCPPSYEHPPHRFLSPHRRVRRHLRFEKEE